MCPDNRGCTVLRTKQTWWDDKNDDDNKDDNDDDDDCNRDGGMVKNKVTKDKNRNSQNPFMASSDSYSMTVAVRHEWAFLGIIRLWPIPFAFIISA